MLAGALRLSPDGNCQMRGIQQRGTVASPRGLSQGFVRLSQLELGCVYTFCAFLNAIQEELSRPPQPSAPATSTWEDGYSYNSHL